MKGETVSVIITGGNNGIGLALARHLLIRGYKVAIMDRENNNIGQLPGQPGRLLFCRCDVTSDNEVRLAVQTVSSTFGSIDILVNNACQAIFAAFEERTIEDIREELEVNYFGYVRMIMAVLPFMKLQGHGLIHNVSSGVGITGFPKLTGYTSSKGAIEALTKSLDLELKKQGIRVNLIHPPLTRTKSSSSLGIPIEMMTDPEVVGLGLAKRIESKSRTITHNRMNRLFVWISYRFPYAIGKLMSKMTERAVEKKQSL